MTSSVTYNEALRTTCVHLRSGSSIETDAPVDNNGKGERFSPTDLLATSIATCMLTVMGIKARTMDFDLNDIKVDVLKTMAANPRRVSRVDLTFHFPEALKNIDSKTQKILKNTGENCPVLLSIHPAIAVHINWSDWQ